ncbi:unnamed protein product [Cylindrotheca closterium]|uniref:phytol kinase n=1 Tax=Cylindrotheca closterium TaxID=2856 RepID=A0AAD2FQQ8_9STRA|nr:unnamed protein product [Cylindrotheca closterium]
MGKKSRKKSCNSAATTSGNADLSSSVESAIQNLVAETTPQQGWASELKAAEKAYKRKPNDVDVILRLLKCLLVMRHWEKGTQVTKDVRTFVVKNENTTDDKKRKFLELSQQLQQIKPRRPMSNDDKDFCRQVFGGTSPDNCLHPQDSFCNLGPLHYAALSGEVEYFERLVALGASIDYPPLPIEKVRLQLSPQDLRNKTVAPKSWTALLLVCSTLAMGARVPLRHLKKQLENHVEIAIQLVKLGADTSAVLGADEEQLHQSIFSPYRQLGVLGKTAFELAKMSKRKELVDAMIEFQNQDLLKEKVQCRCGSRLPLKTCHGCDFDEERHLMREDDCGRLYFRYSPLAPCPCNQTKKTHYDCCWDGATMRFNNDRTAELFGHHKIHNTTETSLMFNDLMKRKLGIEDDGPDLSGVLVGTGDMSSEVTTKLADRFRTEAGAAKFHNVFNMLPKNRRFDPQVYAGCLERISNCFFWRDDHWKIDKPELLVRVKEWNQALEQYCDDEGLTSQQRENVIRLHKASPLAPCGNPGCSLVETKVKEFQRCGRCRTISYCSRNCQGKHWKAGHKKECFI